MSLTFFYDVAPERGGELVLGLTYLDRRPTFWLPPTLGGRVYGNALLNASATPCLLRNFRTFPLVELKIILNPMFRSYTA
jgi:hypothetical protein